MKIQVHHTEVTPLIKEGYEKVYDALGKLLSDDEFIFAEWKAGFGDMLQWTLPADAEWLALTDADSFDRNAVINEFLRLKAIGESKLGKNKKLIESVYSVPAENFVYYFIDSQGRYHIMLSGWGYSYPRSAPMIPLVGLADPAMQNVTLRFIENSKPLSGIRFDLPRKSNRTIHLTADSNGEKSLGTMMPGTTVSIFIPSVAKHFSFEIKKGKEVYTADLTIEQTAEITKVTPPEDNPFNEEPQQEQEQEQEQITVRNRDITIRFIGFDGKPLTGREIQLIQTGRSQIAELTDSNGNIYLDKTDFATGLPLEAAAAAPYPNTALILDEGENEYLIIFHEKKSSSWLIQLLIGILAIAAAIGTWIAITELLNL